MIVGWFPLSILALMLGSRFPWLPVFPTYFGIVGGIPICLAWLISRIFKRHDGGRISIAQGMLRVEFGVFLRSHQEISLENQCRFSSSLQTKSPGADAPRLAWVWVRLECNCYESIAQTDADSFVLI